MNKRKVKIDFNYKEWEFTKAKELIKHAQRECIVCGDSVKISIAHNGINIIVYEFEKIIIPEDVVRIEIYNYHMGTVRWRGTVQQEGRTEL